MERRSALRLTIEIETLICSVHAAVGRFGSMPSDRNVACRHGVPMSLGRVANLSQHGIFLETSHREAREGELLEVDLLLRNAGVDGYAHCELKVARAAADGYGLSAAGCNDFSRAVLARLFQRHIDSSRLDRSCTDVALAGRA